jgi:hypothetical protein
MNEPTSYQIFLRLQPDHLPENVSASITSTRCSSAVKSTRENEREEKEKAGSSRRPSCLTFLSTPNSSPQPSNDLAWCNVVMSGALPPNWIVQFDEHYQTPFYV